MALNYKQSDVSGTKWRRASRVVIDNNLDQTPRCTFVEEEVLVAGDDKIHKMVGSISFDVDPNEMVTMIDPQTNEPTTTQYPVSLAQWIIYSLYWKKVTERDAQQSGT